MYLITDFFIYIINLFLSVLVQYITEMCLFHMKIIMLVKMDLKLFIPWVH